MKKRFLTLLLAAALSFSLAAPALAAGDALPFEDVKSTDWYYDSLKTLYDAGVINGTSTEPPLFSPQGSVTVGEALKMILLAAGYEAQDPITTHWASGYYLLASNEGLLPDGMTDLSPKITRLQIAQIAVAALNLERTSSKTPFADTKDEAALILYDHGIFTGVEEDGKLLFKPKATITRAEVSAVMQRMYALVDRTGYQPPAPAELPDGPAQEGEYITYGKHKVYIVEDLPKNSYDNALFTVNENGFLTYDDENWSCKIGIDVSRYQYDIDWAQVATSDVEWAILRLGYRGYGTGALVLDNYFYKNLQGALKNDIEVGVYFFSQAITPEEARAEARFCLEALEGYDITYPIVFDWEPYGSSTAARTDDLDDRVLTQCAVAFCQEVEAAGYESMVYSNLNYFYTHFDLNHLTDYPLWLAQYNEVPSFYYHFDIWQYGSKPIVPGIDGEVDLNIQFIPKH